MHLMKINPWYLENVLLRNEGLKYLSDSYKLTIIEVVEETGYYNVKIEDYDTIIFYDIPPSQLITNEEF